MANRNPSHIPHRVAVVGCGFAGLAAARALRLAPVEVTIIDRTNHHLFQPLLYQVATGILSEGDIAPPIRDILRRQHNARVLFGDVEGINLEERWLAVNSVGERTQVPYDSLILATGADQSYFGHPEFARHAPGMKTIDHALELRGRIFGSLEMAEREPDPDIGKHWTTFVVVGAGPTGVELAGQIAELTHRSMQRNFRRIDPSTARVLLLDAAPTLLGPFPESLQRRAEKTLEGLGVEIHLGAMVTGVDEHGITTNSDDPGLRSIDAATKIWAAGVEASPLGRLVAQAGGAEVDRAGRVKVETDCTLPGHPEVFVVGDLMSLDGLPGLAQVAIQSGRHAASLITRRLHGDTAERPFRYKDKGTMATISRFQAVASIGRLRTAGFLAWLLWLAVHLVSLAGFKNRLAVLANWTIAFVGRGRPQRAITVQQVFAREALSPSTPKARSTNQDELLGKANTAGPTTKRKGHAMTTTEAKQDRSIRNVTVLGTGVLGAQIAYQAANCDFAVTAYDISDDALGKAKLAFEGLAARYEREVEGAAGGPAREALTRISYQSDLPEAVRHADLVVEAVPENLELKRKIFAQLGQAAPEKTIFATNSSSLLPSDLAESTGRPDRFLAMHFANQIWVHNTAEIMGHPGTDPAVYQTVVEFAREIHMLPIELKKEQPGYVLNALAIPWMGAAMKLLVDGIADPETIDNVWCIDKEAPEGPFHNLDRVGLNTAYEIFKAADDPKLREAAQYIKENYIDKGKLGQPTGEGFFTYRAA